MFKFLKKYSLVLFLAMMAGLLIGYKVFVDTETSVEADFNSFEKPGLVEGEIFDPTPTVTPTPTSPPRPTPTPEITDEKVEQLLEELNIDIDNPTMEDIGKLFELLEELEEDI